MTEPIRVLIADDHALFRRGLCGLLAEQPDFVVAGEAGSGPEAVRLAASTAPDVVLMDVHMPEGGGVEAVRQLKASGEVRVLMLTISDRDEDLFAALAAGADGYLLKSLEPQDLYRAIRQAAQGHGALSPEVTDKVLRAAARQAVHAPSPALTPREREVLALLAQGASTHEIAARLVISPATVKTHVRNLLDKLEASNRAEAVARAASLGLLPDPSD